MSVARNNKSEIHKSEQQIQNWSFDEEYKVLVQHTVGYDGQALVRQEANDMQVKIVESGGYTYICKAAVGTAEATAKWKIYRIDATGNKVYADGNASYDNVASDPASLTYSYT